MHIDGRHVQTVILAAGMGMRLRGISGDLPKALVPVAGKALLDHALTFAAQLAPGEEPIVIGGYRFDLLEKHHSNAIDVRYKMVNNRAYQLGSIHSLLAALPLISGSFFIINADHIFSPEAANRFREGMSSEISIFCDQSRELVADDMKVDADSAIGLQVRNMSKTLSSYRFGYIGVTFVPGTALAQYKAASGEVIQEYGDQASVERVIQVLADRGNVVTIKVLDDLRWCEVDTPSDFQIAAQRVIHLEH